MRTMIDGVALLAGIMGIAAGAAAGENDAGVAGKRGLSPIISISSDLTIKLTGLSQEIITPELNFLAKKILSENLENSCDL